MKKITFFLMAMLFSVMSFAAEATLSFADKAQRTVFNSNQQVWEQNGITLTNDKASSTNAVADYAKPARFYKNSKITVKCNLGTITQIVFDCNSGSYATALNSSITSGTATVSSDKVTVVPATESDEYVIASLTGGQVRMDAITVTYKPAEIDPDVVMYEVAAEECTVGAGYGTVSGTGNYAEGSTVTLTATPTPGYVFDSWDNGSKENPLTLTVTGNIYQCATFIPQTAITIAEALELPNNATGVLNYFTVTYVNGSNIYIKDESGYALAYRYNYGLKAGDGVNFMAFTKSTFNDIPQLIPETDYNKLTIIPGEAPAIDEITTAPTVADNRLVKLMNVSLVGEFNTTANATINATCQDGSTINIYNNKTVTATFTEGKTYNILGGVTQYKGVIQIQAYEVEEYVAPVTYYNIYLTASEGGEVEGEGEFEAGEQVTVSALANEGYEFVNWTEGEEVVSTNANYTFEVTGERNLVANFQLISETVYFINNENWEGDIYAYAWKDGGENNNEWPGVLAEKLETPYEGFEEYDAYSYTALYGQYDYVIFTNGQGQQTIDHPWVGNAFYYIEKGPEVAAMWTVAGTPIFGTVWNETDANNDMRLQDDGTYVWEKTDIELAAGNKIEFKVVKNHNWDIAYPSQNYALPITESGFYTITITFNAGTTEVYAVATKTADSDVVVNYEYVLMGVGDDWETGIALTQNPEDANEYTLIGQEILDGDYVKVVTIIDGVKSNYCGNVHEYSTVPYSFDGLGNIVLAPGTYDFYYYVTEDIIFIDGEVAQPEPELVRDVITNMEFDFENMLIIGGPSAEYQIEVILGIAEENEDGSFALAPESTVSIMGSEATIIDGAAYEIDPYAPAALVDLVVSWGGAIYQIHLEMSAAPMEATVVLVNDAVIEVEEYDNFGSVGYALTMTGTWTDEEGLEYPVLVEIPEYDPEATEAQTTLSTVTVGGWADEDPWLGFGEGNLTITIEGSVITATGVVENPMAGVAIDITISGILQEEGPTYEVYEDVITNFAFDLEAWPMVCAGGPSDNFQVEVYLVLGEEDNIDSWPLSAESTISVMGTEATFIEGYLKNIDPYAPAADAVIRCDWGGMLLEFHLSMSAAPMEATVVVVEDATVTVNKQLIFGDVYDYSLTMTGTWTDEGGLEYPVLVEVPVYYPEATEPSTILSTVTVGGWEETENWLGFGEGELEITTVEGVVKATGIVENPGVIAIDITISGKLPTGPTTGLENLDTTAAPAKVIENGQLIIIRDGVKYNAVGAIVK